ncbi:MAG: hypothetical protein LBK99_04890 [Opitutaceae bacterium]|nr:hypothetical protein [Opitutaceae bacterium]
MTYIIKDAGKRQIPFDRERITRYLGQIHAEFSQLDLEDYRTKLFTFIESRETFAADDLVDAMIREAESRTDVHLSQWEMFAARLYLNKLYKKASKNRFYDADDRYGSYVGL